MALSERKKEILRCVIESYISDGEAVGSRTLQAMLDFNVSSATIRNEMVALENSGYLIQPHTSAGRVPTESGYRYYLDNLMNRAVLNERVTAYINGRMEQNSSSPENVLETASAVLSELTQFCAVATTPADTNSRIHKIRFVRTGRHTGMAVVITSTGTVKTRLFRTEYVLSDDMLRVFERALNERLCGVLLIEINRAFIQTTALSFGELSLFMPNVLIAVSEAAQEAAQMSVFESGTTKLMFLSDFDIYSARDAVKFMSDRSGVAGLLTSGTGTRVFVGAETGRYELKNAAAVVSHYTLDGTTAGAVAVIGPRRMSYSEIISATEYVAEKCGDLINDLIELK